MIEDYLRKVRGVYYASPQWLKSAVGRTYASMPIKMRLGKEYLSFRNMLQESRYWDSQAMLDYQYLKLKETIEVAYRYIPYYIKRFNEFGVTPSTLKSPEDLYLFPTLTKRDVKENYQELINPNIAKHQHLVTTTGGSTAEPMRFLHIKGLTRSKEKAFIYAGWNRLGYKPGVKAIQIKGRSVGNPDKCVFWEYEPIQNILEMDSNYLTQEYIPYYIKAILKFGAKYIIAFPSSIYLIAKYLQNNNIEIPNLKGIFLASENVYPWQRELLKSVFDCRIFSHYGHSEMVLLGMEAEDSHDLLFFPEYGFLEVINESGEILKKHGQQGELVGTSFDNILMPFIRYRTQDIGVIGGADPRGGRYPVLQDVEGRLQEFIVTADQRLISICTMGAAHFDVLDKVYETQYYQDKPGEVTFMVVPKPGYTDSDRDKIYKSVKNKTGKDVQVNVREVDSISRTKNGKHMMIVQKIPLNILEGKQGLVLPDE